MELNNHIFDSANIYNEAKFKKAFRGYQGYLNVDGKDQYIYGYTFNNLDMLAAAFSNEDKYKSNGILYLPDEGPKGRPFRYRLNWGGTWCSQVYVTNVDAHHKNKWAIGNVEYIPKNSSGFRILTDEQVLYIQKKLGVSIGKLLYEYDLEEVATGMGLSRLDKDDGKDDIQMM